MITFNTDVNAPCCIGEIVNDNGESILIQTDWDWPGVASTFGWDKTLYQVQGTHYYGLPLCDHSETDGTIDCPECGLTAAGFIREAGEFLRNADGIRVDDPGYFPDSTA